MKREKRIREISVPLHCGRPDDLIPAWEEEAPKQEVHSAIGGAMRQGAVRAK